MLHPEFTTGLEEKTAGWKYHGQVGSWLSCCCSGPQAEELRTMLVTCSHSTTAKVHSQKPGCSVQRVFFLIRLQIVGLWVAVY